MASLRVQGLPHLNTLDSVIKDLKDKYNLQGWKTAAQSEKYSEATLTFKSERDRRKAAEHLDKLIADDPTRFKEAVTDYSFSGITVLWCNDPVVDIIAVHGLGGHGAATWTSSSKGLVKLWLRDILPQDLDRSRIITFGYDAATISRSTASIRDVATQLLNDIQTIRRSDMEKSRPVVFMAHSLGGIVVKWALKLSRTMGTYSDIDKQTCAIVFFGTPHHGSGTANWADVVASVVNVVKTTNTNYLDMLKSRSQSLADLDDDFVPLLRDGKFKIISIYETQKTKIRVWKSIEVVRKDSALLRSTNEIPVPANADHRSVCKFKDSHESAYRTLCSYLVDLLPKPTLLNSSAQPQIGEIPSKIAKKQVSTYPKNVPQDRYFYGRGTILEKMQVYLNDKKSNASGPRCLALYGEPAVGKTSLVNRFVQIVKNEYDYILLIPAETKTKLSQEFVNIGRSLELANSIGDDPKTVKEQVLHYLNTTDKAVLIVFDNADNLDELNNLKEFWPYTSDCSILVTSRYEDVVWRLPAKTEGMRIESMTEAEGEEFLIDRLKAGTDADTRSISRSVAVRFNCWPLALSQVSAWILETRTTLKRFWDILSKRPETANRIYAYKDKESSYEYTLSQVWDSILSTLDENSARLLSVLSLMDPDSIPDRLLREWNPAASQAGDSEVPDEYVYIMARKPLLNYSIIQISEDVLALHRIVQSTRLRSISDSERSEAFQSALTLLAASFPQQVLGNHMHEQWVDCEIILPHVLSFDNAISTFGWSMIDSNARTYVNMMCDATWYLWEIGQYDEAFTRLNTADKICSATIGLQNLEAARLYVTRGCILSTFNRYAEAGALFQKGLEIRKELLPPDDQLLANSYMQVGNFLLNEDRFDEAIDAQEKVIAIREKSYHLLPSMMAISYLNLSRSLLGARRFDDAIQALSNSARCAQDVGSEKEKLFYEANRLYVLGNVSLARGHLTEALQFHQDALKTKIDCKMPPFSIAASRHKLGDIFARLNDFASAKAYLDQTIGILEKVQGQSSAKLTRIARAEMRLSEVCAMSGDTREAEYMREKAIQRLQNAMSLSMEVAQKTDFDKLVAYLDR